MPDMRRIELEQFAMEPAGGVINYSSLLDSEDLEELTAAGDNTFQFVMNRVGYPMGRDGERVLGQWVGSSDTEVQGTWLEDGSLVATGVVAIGTVRLLLSEQHLWGSYFLGHVRSGPEAFTELGQRDCYVFEFKLSEIEWIMANKKAVGFGTALGGLGSNDIVPATGESWKFPMFGNKSGEFARQLLEATLAAKDKHPDAGIRQGASRVRASRQVTRFGTGRDRVEINFNEDDVQ